MNTKNIQLIALGNGIVDMQYRVSDSMLAKLGTPKSEMRLVSQQEQFSVIELLMNIVPHRCNGGSATNTIDAFAKFGGKAAYLTSVGDDGNGKYYYNELATANITFKNNIIPNTPTGTCVVLITPDGERTMLTCLAASKQFSLEHLDADLIASSEWLYIEGYKFSEASGAGCIAKAIEIAKSNNTKIAISASDVFIVNQFRALFTEAIKQADLIFCNENEALSIAECSDSDDAFTKISTIVPNIAMTFGGKGSKILYNNKLYEISAFNANVIDTTGAGDLYAAAFLYGLMNFSGENTIARAGSFASKAASLVVSQLGARYLGSFQDIVSKFI